LIHPQPFVHPERAGADERQYRLLQLPDNRLPVLLIHDPSTEKSAASMSVAVGHMSDPDDLPGLAHFTEHMCFLGTERFPDEAEYGRGSQHVSCVCERERERESVCVCV
jgi:insulysin